MADGRGLLTLAPQGARGFESHRLRPTLKLRGGGPRFGAFHFLIASEASWSLGGDERENGIICQ